MKIVFHISKGLLSVFPNSGGLYTIFATSGRGECRNVASEECQKAAFEGSIPIGAYYLDPKDIDDPNFLWDLGRRLRGDWGDWRIRLMPTKSTITHGRDNFFIHGGDTKGSAGCIDIGGGILGNQQTDRLKNDILSADHNILLEVIK